MRTFVRAFVAALAVVGVGLAVSTALGATPQKALVVIMSYCSGPTMSSQLVARTMQEVVHTLRLCSNNKFALDYQVLDTVIQTPCPSGCDYQSLAEMADKLLWKHTGYRHHVYVLPSELKCAFGGMGQIGCPYDGKEHCRAWINADVGDKADTYVHELGHNFGLQHAASLTGEYGDDSSAMGYCCKKRCYNPPQTEQLGWTRPTVKIDASSYMRQTFNATLCCETISSCQYMRIRTSGLFYYLQYKKPNAFEELPPSLTDTVNVYVTAVYENPPGIPYVQQEASRIETALQPEQSWKVVMPEGYSIVAEFLGFMDSCATVSVRIG